MPRAGCGSAPALWEEHGGNLVSGDVVSGVHVGVTLALVLAGNLRTCSAVVREKARAVAVRGQGDSAVPVDQYPSKRDWLL